MTPLPARIRAALALASADETAVSDSAARELCDELRRLPARDAVAMAWETMGVRCRSRQDACLELMGALTAQRRLTAGLRV